MAQPTGGAAVLEAARQRAARGAAPRREGSGMRVSICGGGVSGGAGSAAEEERFEEAQRAHTRYGSGALRAAVFGFSGAPRASVRDTALAPMRFTLIRCVASAADALAAQTA
jgi:hypothetical protein